MDESRLLGSVIPSASTFVSGLIQALKQAKFDVFETPTELRFGVLDTTSDTFLPLIRLHSDGLYAAHTSRLFEILSPNAISEHRRALNKMAPFYKPEVLDPNTSPFWVVTIGIRAWILLGISEDRRVSIGYKYSRHNMSLLPFAFITAIFWVAVPVYSQRLLLGVKVAGQATNTFAYPYTPPNLHEDRILFGPTLEMRLARSLSLEVDALYKKKLDYSFQIISHQPFSPRGTADVSNHAWELPLIMKWRLLVRRAPIFAGAGFSARKVAGITHFYGTQTAFFPGQPTTFDDRTSQSEWTYGPVVMAGFDVRAHMFHFQPELRYTRWNDSPLFATKPDDVQLLIGIAVETRKHRH